MNILAVVAHPDDEILGCGAALRKLADEGHTVYTCVLCGDADARHARPDLERLERVIADANKILKVTATKRCSFRNIQFNAVPHLEIVREIERAIAEFKPEWVFTHSPGDLNIDHRVCYEATMAAIRLPQRLSADLPVTMIRKVLLFEVLSSSDWASPLDPPFVPNTWMDVGETLSYKLDALEAFEGALKPFPHSRSRENVVNLARLRGAQIGIETAEAFVTVRDLL